MPESDDPGDSAGHPRSAPRAHRLWPRRRRPNHRPPPAVAVRSCPSRPTIWRILKSNGLIEPQPHKRPKSSWIRFQAELPNELWQADSTHWLLADGTDVEVLNVIDDHSRFALASVAFRTAKAPDALHTFYAAAESYGYRAKFLSDNAAVFSGAPRRGRVVLESELDRLGIESKHSSPYHPQTCGKVEGLHQTLKRYLSRQASAESLAHPQLQLDSFRTYYNHAGDHKDLWMAGLHSKLSRPGSKPARLCSPHRSSTESVVTSSTAAVE